MLGHLELPVIVLGHLDHLLQGKACLQSLGNHLGMARLSIMSMHWNLAARFFITCLRGLFKLDCPCTGNKNGLLLPNSTSDQGKSSAQLPDSCDQPYHCFACRDALLSIRLCWKIQSTHNAPCMGKICCTKEVIVPYLPASILPLQHCQQSLKASIRCRIATHQE